MFFIPTPGQYEQEYLAEIMMQNQSAPSCKQADFKISKLDIIENFDGLKTLKNDVNWNDLFKIFR